jgi:hypothetical protein
MLGDTVELAPVGKQRVMLTHSRKRPKAHRKKTNVEDLRKLFDTEPKRTGKPQNPSPSEMKAIWNE